MCRAPSQVTIRGRTANGPTVAKISCQQLGCDVANAELKESVGGENGAICLDDVKYNGGE